MKKLVYSIGVVLIIWLLAYGQDFKMKNYPMPSKTINVPLLDSSYRWIGTNFNTLIEKMIVTARVPNASPFLEAERMYHVYDTINNVWRNYQKDNYTYFGTNSGSPYESILIRPWSLALNAWDDTSYYIKYTGKMNFQIPYPQNIITKQIQSNYDYANSQYTYKQKDVYTLLNDSCPAEHISYSFNLITQAYEPSNKRIFSYNSSNELTSITYQYYDQMTSQFLNSMKESFTYNGNLLLQSLIQYWNGTNWENSTKNIRTYDANNRLIQYLSLMWNGTSWDSSFKQLYYYTPTADSIINYMWNVNTWIPTFKNVTFYNSQGITTGYAYYSWDSTSWYVTSITTYTYNSQGNLTQILSKYWDGTQLVNNSQILYYYSGNTNDSTIVYYWDQMANNWVPSSKSLYTYGTLGELLMEKSYYFMIGNWIENQKLQHFYQLVDISAIPVLTKNESFTIYPNPANDFINIALKDQLPINRMIIRDAQGKVVYDQNNSSRTIDIKKLPLGMYYLSIVTVDNQVISKPFIKQ